jgi:putative transposase
MSLFIDAHRDRFGVEPICRALQFAPSTYYARKERERNPCARALRDRELVPEIRRVHEENLSVYAPRRHGGSWAARASPPPAVRSSA